jgi:adiponectin receptor
MCENAIHWAYFYVSFINIASLILVIICVHPSFDNVKFRKWRTGMYVIVGLSCGVPGIHCQFFSSPGEFGYTNLYLWALGGFFFVLGAYIYFIRFPEKKYPGKFDYFGQSHNIWHLFVFLGAFTHFIASLSSYYGRRVEVCPV